MELYSGGKLKNRFRGKEINVKGAKPRGRIKYF